MIEATEPRTLDECARVLRRIGKRLYRAGQLPATSGNLSLRIDAGCCAITLSGRDKGRLSRVDVASVSLKSGLPCRAPEDATDGERERALAALEPRPSAETPLHISLYRRYPEVGAIFHTHSAAATVISRLAQQDEVVLDAYELAKAWRGVPHAPARLTIPVFDNDPNLERLSEQVLEVLNRPCEAPCFAYLIRSHGAYVWGQTWQEAFRHVEALELMLTCELAERQITGPLRMRSP
jgi:methylthioribulose-1-phosphate dehydratase